MHRVLVQNICGNQAVSQDDNNTDNNLGCKKINLVGWLITGEILINWWHKKGANWPSDRRTKEKEHERIGKNS